MFVSFFYFFACLAKVRRSHNSDNRRPRFVSLSRDFKSEHIAESVGKPWTIDPTNCDRNRHMRDFKSEHIGIALLAQ